MKQQHTFTAIVTGILLYGCMHLITFSIFQLPFLQETAFIRQVTFKIIMAVISIVAGVYYFKIPLSEFSLTVNKKKIKQVKFILLAGALGSLTTAVMMCLHLPQIPLIKAVSPVQMLISVWFFSTVCEEIFTRGLVQNLVKDESTAFQFSGVTISKPVLASAIAFGLMHISIYFFGGSIYTCILIMVAAFLLGLIAGKLKEANGLRSAIWSHLAFNVGGFITGVLLKILCRT